MDAREYHALRKLMRSFPLKLLRAREKYIDYLQSASKIAMSDQLTDEDRKYLEILNDSMDRNS